MAGAARVGALHIMLGLDSAEFTAGLAKANSGLAKFAKAAKIGFAVVAAAAVAAGAAMVVALKGAIDRADDLSKTAQRIGVTTEALSRLEWAAKLSDVSLEQLSTGLQRLSRNMLDVANGGGAQAKTAFAALGISIKDTEGNLRSSDAVFADVAERFANMPDGVQKTALAMQLFGRAGADMIPLLNSGKAGLAAMADESDRLGNTLSTNAGRAAESFNDSITRLQAVFTGVINKIMMGIVPGLAALADALSTNVGNFGGLELAVDAVIWVFKEFMIFIAQTKGMLDTVGATIFSVGRAMEALKQGDAGAAGMALAQTGLEVDEIWKGVAQTISEINSGTLGGAEGGTGGGGTNPLIPDVARIQAASAALKQLASDGKAVFEATRTPAEKYGLEIAKLNTLLQKGAIDQDTYNRAVIQAQDAFQQAEFSGNQLAQTLSTGLATMFSSVVDGSKDAVSAIGDLLKSLGDMLIHQGFQALIGGMFGGGGGGGLGGILGGLFGGGGGLKLGFNGIPGFDGGGYTGGGSRSGGLDGKGGFLSMLHPDETVLDHTRGQGGGGGINITIHGSRQDAADIAREVRKVLPDAMAAANRNPYRRS